MQQQLKIVPLICNRADHLGGTILGLCLREICQSKPALCFRCTLELHKDCNAFIKPLEDIPKLLQPLQQMKFELTKLLQTINLQISKLVGSIEQSLKPIDQYINNPNITNLNNLGIFLKTKVSVVTSSEIEDLEQTINTIFDKVKVFKLDIEGQQKKGDNQKIKIETKTSPFGGPLKQFKPGHSFGDNIQSKDNNSLDEKRYNQ